MCRIDKNNEKKGHFYEKISNELQDQSQVLCSI